MKKTVSRTKALYEKQGYAVWVVEQWIQVPKHPAGGIRRDMYNFADLVAIKVGHPILAIQTCSGDRHADHLRAIEENDYADIWEHAGGAIHLVSWKKRAVRTKKGTSVKRWKPRVQVIALGAEVEPVCELCRCTELDACEGGCCWSNEFADQGRWVCTNCVEKAA